jgi:hypothetical protein
MDSKMKKLTTSLIIVFIITINIAKSQSTFNSLEEVWLYAIKNNSENNVYQLQIEKNKNRKENGK